MSDRDREQFCCEGEEIEMAILKTSHQPVTEYKPSKRQNLVWKYQTIQKAVSPPKLPKQKPKNISFQSEELSIDQIQQDSDQECQSALAAGYAQYQQIYSKKKSFGTNWIGNKQYFASVFIDPWRIQRSETTPFQLYNENASYTHSSNKQQIVFDSDFESGNLFAVYKIGSNEYDLMVQNDINTKGNTQWFYFRMRNIPVNQDIKINLVNMMKSDSLFNYGMLPCVQSAEAEAKNNQGWSRRGTKVRYFKNDTVIQGTKRCYHTLTFTISTPYSGDQLRVAQCYPYTLSDLSNYLDGICKIHEKKGVLTRQTLGYTLGKNPIQILTIKESNPRRKTRDIIVIFARQHPGQTPGSYVCEGIIDFLLSKDREAEFLRKNCEFKIFPILNPDGVYVGNYRTNLLGVDLNRRWSSFNSKYKHYTESLLIKDYLNDLSKKANINFILDLHGHSRKLFSFFYGNPSVSDPTQVRIFPYLCSKLAPDLIRFQDSTFSYEECKRKTARIQLNLAFRVPNIFTFQTSFFGYQTKDLSKKHFTQQGFKNLGRCIGKGLYIQQVYNVHAESKQALFYKRLISDLKNDSELVKIGQNAESGSQSNPSECQIGQNEQKKLQNSLQYSKQLPIKSKKFVKKIIKKQLPKDYTRSSRQMVVMEMPRVNSVFPNDVLALVPNSYLVKHVKRERKETGTQCDDVSILKIYEANRNNQARGSLRENIFAGKMLKLSEKSSNLFKSVMRPHSSTNYSVQFHCQGNINPKTHNYHEIRQIKAFRQQKGTIIKNNKKLSHNSKSIQTALTLPPNCDLLGDSLSKQAEGLFQNPEKNVSFRTIQNHSVHFREERKTNAGFKIGLRAISIQTWKIKKKSLFGV